MSAFKALNIESDDDTDDEIDNTKEIQIEEALKLYQAALKFHSDGPASFSKAGEAYKDLFQSDIFKYPESQSEFSRPDLYDPTSEYEVYLQDDFASGPVQSLGVAEVAPNTLPQIIHLSQKNYGQFILDCLSHRLKQSADGNEVANIEQTAAAQTSTAALDALRCFAEALDKDDTDLDLWRRTASVATLNDSARISRFCLEAILDGDEEGLDSVLSLPGIEQAFATQQLKVLIEKTTDDLSLRQPPISAVHTKALPQSLLKRLGLDIVVPQKEVRPVASRSPTRKPCRVVVAPLTHDWAMVGQAILNQVLMEQSGYVDYVPGCSLEIDLPPTTSTPDVQSTEGNAMQGIPFRVEPNNIVVGKPEEERSRQMSPMKTEAAGSNTAADQDGISGFPSRKRSTDSAGLPETAEGGRIRSKRIRARETIEGATAEPTAVDKAKHFEARRANFDEADRHMSDTVESLYVHLGISGSNRLDAVRTILNDSNETEITSTGCAMEIAVKDLSSLLSRCTPESQGLLRTGESLDQLAAASRTSGLNTFLVHKRSVGTVSVSTPALSSSNGLSEWVRLVNDCWLSAKEVAMSWLQCLLKGDSFPTSMPSDEHRSSYMIHQWPDELKKWVVQVAVNLDEFIYDNMLDKVRSLDESTLAAHSRGEPYKWSRDDHAESEMIETLFELHLDVYSLIKLPSSKVGTETEISQHDRLERWCQLARHALSLRQSGQQEMELDELALRHMWASVFQLRIYDDVPQEHAALCMREMKSALTQSGNTVIHVQNNAVMPEISVPALERELTRISMRGFFDKVFTSEDADPVAMIETLEPILDHSTTRQVADNEAEAADTDSQKGSGDIQSDSPAAESYHKAARPASPVADTIKFLESADINDRLSLWQRLRKAYEAIDYPPKVVSCHLRCIEMLVQELKSARYQDTAPDHREVMLLSFIRLADDLLASILDIVNSETTAFEIIDERHLQSSLLVIAELLALLHVGNLYDDGVRVGEYGPLTMDGRPIGSHPTLLVKLREAQIRAWTLQYALLKEALCQKPSAYPLPNEAKINMLHYVHQVVGVRSFCNLQGKGFLKLLKDELLYLHRLDNCEDQLAQVLYDIYGLRFSPALPEPADHGCVADALDKRTALNILDFVMAQARKVGTKDLPKTELRVTIDKVHGALGKSKSNDDLALNRRLLLAYLKSPINPLDLYRCLDGIGELSTKPVRPQDAVIASKGWYSLMGEIAFNRFLSQKKVTQSPTEDLNIAIAFFVQDLEYSTERWTTWFRLAQAHYCQVEESVSWTAEKMNGNNHELSQQQRYMIHSYAMAVACAVRSADLSAESVRKMADLYGEFGMRIYSSCQPPFCNSAFKVKESEERFYSRIDIIRAPSFGAMHRYDAWKFASVLCRKAVEGKPTDWMCHYMLGKCLWKMHTARDPARRRPHLTPPDHRSVINAFVRSIETLPERKDSRREPILEPHYKLVSVVHKLVQRKEVPPEDGSNFLQATHYARKVPRSTDSDTWETHILRVLKSLRNADKSAWHHRMTARAAHVIYDDSPGDSIAAAAAKHELTQHIFTKTMAIQVWRPENERPGRHFVYTSRYLQFFVHLLVQLGDRASMDLLSKRVRKKPLDFFEHSSVWQDFCVAYVQLLRRHGKVAEGYEEAIFKSINHDEFVLLAARLETWCLTDAEKPPVFEALREAVELKKTNNSLMKGPLIDDLICDAYAALYAQITHTLEAAPTEAAPQQLAQPYGDPRPDVTTDRTSNMMSVTSLMNVDGNSDSHSQSNFVFQVQPSTMTDYASKPRTKGVGRREVLRRAEACTNKPPPPPQTTVTSMPAIPIRPPSRATDDVQVASESRPPAPADEPARAGPPAEESAPASVHDSADDESELSELEDEIVLRPMFPGLIAHDAAQESVSASSAASPEPMDLDQEQRNGTQGQQ